MSFLTYLISGLSLGSIYAIIALGYTMVYGIAKMLNFAHGDFIMVGCYIIFSVSGALAGNSLVGIVVAIILCTLLGITTEFVAYRPLRGAASPLAVLITAIGVSYFLEMLPCLFSGQTSNLLLLLSSGRDLPLQADSCEFRASPS